MLFLSPTMLSFLLTISDVKWQSFYDCYYNKLLLLRRSENRPINFTMR